MQRRPWQAVMRVDCFLVIQFALSLHFNRRMVPSNNKPLFGKIISTAANGPVTAGQIGSRRICGSRPSRTSLAPPWRIMKQFDTGAGFVPVLFSGSVCTRILSVGLIE